MDPDPTTPSVHGTHAVPTTLSLLCLESVPTVSPHPFPSFSKYLRTFLRIQNHEVDGVFSCRLPYLYLVHLLPSYTVPLLPSGLSNVKVRSIPLSEDHNVSPVQTSRTSDPRVPSLSRFVSITFVSCYPPVAPHSTLTTAPFRRLSSVPETAQDFLFDLNGFPVFPIRNFRFLSHTRF